MVKKLGQLFSHFLTLDESHWVFYLPLQVNPAGITPEMSVALNLMVDPLFVSY
jgi:hypothetical protein